MASSWHTIRLDKMGVWFILRVYDDVHALRRAANRYHPELKGQPDDPAGVFQSARLGHRFPPGVEVTQELIDAVPPHEWSWPTNGYIGVMRLSQDRLLDEIIVHESLHAALRVNERQWWYAHRSLPEFGWMPAEVWLCYAHGAIVAKVNAALGRPWTTLLGDCPDEAPAP